MKDYKILAIDTSCDETSASVTFGSKVLSNIMPSQIEFHKKYGGVVPSVARLAHEQRIDGVCLEALKKSKLTMDDIDFIAVTKGPGLAIALEVGIKKAKELAQNFKKPLIPMNHMEGHLLSVFGQRNSENIKEQFSPKLPAIGILVSGKHTELILVKEIGEYEIIGETMDDACGEAFDKCGRIVGLGYPAGPVIAKFAKENRKKFKLHLEKRNQSLVVVSDKSGFALPIAMANSNDLNFSYSGLKTAFKSLVKKIDPDNVADIDENNIEQFNLTKEQIYELCVLFEEAAFKPIELKLEKAIKQYNPKEIWLGGGVSINANLRSKIRRICKVNGITFRFPESGKLNTDNAAMIGVAANLRLNKSNIDVLKTDYSKIDREPSMRL